MTKQDILNYFDDINEAYNNCNKYDDLSRMLDELIEAQPRWIPCSEMLPEDCTEVFVYLFDNSCPHIAWIKDTHWYTEDFEIERENEPIAWMPLPEPARLDGKEAEI